MIEVVFGNGLLLDGWFIMVVVMLYLVLKFFVIMCVSMFFRLFGGKGIIKLMGFFG